MNRRIAKISKLKIIYGTWDHSNVNCYVIMYRTVDHMYHMVIRNSVIVRQTINGNLIKEYVNWYKIIPQL